MLCAIPQEAGRARAALLQAMPLVREAVARSGLLPMPQHAAFDTLDRVYEAFVGELDPCTRRSQGVYLTPAPIVSFIVQAVDDLLRSRLGLVDGLADTSSWQEVAERNPGLRVPPGTRPEAPFVQVLDPSVGTGAFLVGVIGRVHRTMMARWQKLPEQQRALRWRRYVREHLLPRLHGLELLRPAVALSHFTIAAALRSTGVTLRPSDRISVWQADTLDPSSPTGPARKQVARLRSSLAVTVLIGNPPYSGAAPPASPWIEELMLDYKVTVRTQERQIQRLSNQYVRFLRFMQWKADAAGAAVLGLVTDRGYLDGLLFQDVRRCLLSRADPLLIADLGGASTGSGRPGGDDNVFGIRQAVAISVGVFREQHAPGAGAVRLSTLRGSREEKHRWLASSTVASPAFLPVRPAPPHYRIAAAPAGAGAYERWPSLRELMGSGEPERDRALWQGTGIKTRHDRFALAFTPSEAVQQVRQLAGRHESDEQLVRELHLCTTVHFDVPAARAKAAEPAGALRALVRPIAYRPFDCRYAVWSRAFVCEPKLRTMRHLAVDGNVCLAVLRRDRSRLGRGILVGRGLVAKDYVSNIDDALLWPLYVLDQGVLRVNVQPWVLGRLAQAGIELAPEPPQADSLLGYLYAVQRSPHYRREHREALCRDYPRVPLPRTAELYRRLAAIGAELCALHLLQVEQEGGVRARIKPGTRVQRVRYEPETQRAWLDGSSWLEVPSAAWQHVEGSYRACETWLEARRGRILSAGEVARFGRVVSTILATLQLEQQVDLAIEAHGGWNAAFMDGWVRRSR
jgi:hypothetical protein